jgi:hypothetical protein
MFPGQVHLIDRSHQGWIFCPKLHRGEHIFELRQWLHVILQELPVLQKATEYHDCNTEKFGKEDQNFSQKTTILEK